jgi:hypothetical protein
MMGGGLGIGKAFEGLKNIAEGPLGKVALTVATTAVSGGMINPLTA